jgi:hypothetical protein
VARLGHELGASRVYVLGASPEATLGLWAYDVGTGKRARLVAAVGTGESPPPFARLVERLQAELLLPPSTEPRLALVNSHETAELMHFTEAAQPHSQPRNGHGLRPLELAGWAALATGVPAATVGAALWPRGPGARAGIPLTATGAILAMMGSDWVLVAAATRGRRELGRAVALVAAVWIAGALASGLSQLGQ